MIKRVNSTGRRRISRELIQIEVFDGDPRTFDAVVDLSDFDAPADAQVVLEAACAGSNTIPRFSWGTVGNLVPEENRTLNGLVGENVFFTLKVIDRTEQFGRILGVAENIRPIKGGKKTATGRRGILPVESTDLGDELFRVDFRNEDVYLMVNEKVADLKDRVRYDPFVYALVYPPVIRQILARALDAQLDDEESTDSWAALWLKFGRNLHSEHSAPPAADEDEEQDEWIDDVVDQFCKSHGLLERFAQKAAETTWEEGV